MSSALHTIGSTRGIPVWVFGVPSAQPGAGIPTPTPPRLTTLDEEVWLGAWSRHAVETVRAFETPAASPSADRLATLEAPVAV